MLFDQKTLFTTLPRILTLQQTVDLLVFPRVSLRLVRC